MEPEDNLVMYYAGHGLAEKESNKAYWIPTDAREGREWDYINNHDLWHEVGRIPARHIFLISDSCFSGALYRPRSAKRSVADVRQFQKPSRWILASGGHDELVSDGTLGGHSPFAEALYKVLKQPALDGLRVSKLIDRVTDATAKFARHTPEGRQLPGDEGGQFVFYPKLDEQACWQEATHTHTVKAYERYLSLFPEGKFLQEARVALQKIKDQINWERARKAGTAVALQHYRQQHPDGAFRQEADGLLTQLRQEAQKREAAAYDLHQEAAQEAQRWEVTIQTGSIEGFTHFLLKHPYGTYAQEARNRREALIQQEEKRRKRVLEEDAWKFAKAQHSSEAYRYFLKNYDQSVFAPQAQAFLKKLNRPQKDRPITQQRTKQRPVRKPINKARTRNSTSQHQQGTSSGTNWFMKIIKVVGGIIAVYIILVILEIIFLGYY